LDAIRSTLLFAKGIILVEGDAEMILVPTMFREVFGLSLDEIGVSLVSVGSTEFSNLARLFHSDRIHRKCAILTDGDASIIDLPEDPDADTKEQASCRASQVSGLARRTNLEAFKADNPYIDAFFADHTFEVDFIAEGDNDEYVVSCLGDVYTRADHIATSAEKLRDESLKVAGMEVLRLAKKAGKGWFALLLAERVDSEVAIPDYILSAIAFASMHINKACKLKAARFRLRKFQGNAAHEHHGVAAGMDDETADAADFLDHYSFTFPDDILVSFLDKTNVH